LVCLWFYWFQIHTQYSFGKYFLPFSAQTKVICVVLLSLVW
jgi:hypothetical protein